MKLTLEAVEEFLQEYSNNGKIAEEHFINFITPFLLKKILLKPEDQSSFYEFWEMYDKRVSKEKCMRLWSVLSPIENRTLFTMDYNMFLQHQINNSGKIRILISEINAGEMKF